MNRLALAILIALTPARVVAAPPDADAIIVGAGIAGLSAAWELAQAGANVIVVDMASVYGGHAVMATGDLCLVGTPEQTQLGLKDSPDIAFHDLVRWGEDADPTWARYYAENSRREIYEWLSGMGVRFELGAHITNPAGNTVLRTHRTKGRGLALVTPIYEANLRRPNIRFVWNTAVQRLLITNSRVVGLAAKNSRSDAVLELHAPAVVLATGGFQSNLDLVRQSWPAGIPYPQKFLVGSGVHSMGSGLSLAR